MPYFILLIMYYHVKIAFYLFDMSLCVFNDRIDLSRRWLTLINYPYQ